MFSIKVLTDFSKPAQVSVRCGKTYGSTQLQVSVRRRKKSESALQLQVSLSCCAAHLSLPPQVGVYRHSSNTLCLLIELISHYIPFSVHIRFFLVLHYQYLIDAINCYLLVLYFFFFESAATPDSSQISLHDSLEHKLKRSKSLGKLKKTSPP